MPSMLSTANARHGVVFLAGFPGFLTRGGSFSCGLAALEARGQPSGDGPVLIFCHSQGDRALAHTLHHAEPLAVRSFPEAGRPTSSAVTVHNAISKFDSSDIGVDGMGVLRMHAEMIMWAAGRGGAPQPAREERERARASQCWGGEGAVSQWLTGERHFKLKPGCQCAVSRGSSRGCGCCPTRMG